MLERKLYSADAAARLGLAASTWRDYFSDGRTPGAVELGPSNRNGHPKRADGFDVDRGHVRPYWWPETLDAWKRAGRGARTDLAVTDIIATHPQGFGGHEFEYQSENDVFACVRCGGYEIALRDRETGEIPPCVPK